MTKEAVAIRNRVTEVRMMRASEISPNPRNFRRHGNNQRRAMNALLAEIGIAGALLTYHSPRNDGKLTLVDGQMRSEEGPDVEWPVIVTDLSDDEADRLLAVYDPMAELAEADTDALNILLDEISFDTPALDDLLGSLRPAVPSEPTTKPEPRETSNQYVALVCSTEAEWKALLDRLHVTDDTYSLRSPRKLRRGRVVDAAEVIARFH